MQKVVVIVISHKQTLDKHEEISLRQCFKILFRHPIQLIYPKGLDASWYTSVVPDIKIDFINPKWLSSYTMFRRLKILPFLYKRYSNYEYVLFYELDSFVFRDELEYWCNQDYDYIGAPWFEGYSKPVSDKIIGVGNGGFSLRKIKNLLKISRSFSLIYKRKELLQDFYRLSLRKKSARLLPLLAKMTGITNNTFYLFNTYKKSEDIFWGVYVNRNFKSFKVAKPEEAMKFSFEVNPRLLFHMNNGRLPFGCHSWHRCDFDFWKPFIQKEGYEL